jgi:ParB-like chromosome segregation protein Spo0J
MSDLDNVFPECVSIRNRLRHLDDAKVSALMESMQSIGLRQPITVFMDGDTPVLVTGLHRLEVAKRLGWELMEAFFVDSMEASARELWEIDENLIRAELTELERGEHLKRRKEIFDSKGGSILPTLGGQQKIGFAQDTSSKTGLKKSSINKSIRRAEKIAADVKEMIAATPIADKGVELDALAALPQERQRQVASEIAAGARQSVREAKRAKAARPPLPPCWRPRSISLSECMSRGLDQLDKTIDKLRELLEREEARGHEDLAGWIARIAKSCTAGRCIINHCGVAPVTRAEGDEAIPDPIVPIESSAARMIVVEEMPEMPAFLRRY